MNYNFTIIIPYYQKEYEINLVLKSFTLQEYDKNKFEIIIIDDGSKNKIDIIINKYSNELNISYHYLKHTGNRGKNRNIGAKLAKANRLIFMDSDVIPGKKLLHYFDMATKTNENIVSLGKRNDLLKFDKTFLTENILENNFELLENLPAEKDIRTISINFEKDTGMCWNGNWQIFYSHCFCIWKKTFNKVNGFDENFTGWGAEDIELGYRLFKAGNIIKLNENTISYHLYHDFDFVKIVNSLKKNYQYFFNKHKYWEIELFIRETECWAVQTIIFQEEIKKRKHIVNNLKNINNIKKIIPSKTLLVGIEIESLINLENVEKAFIPQCKINSDKILNIMGLFTEYKEHHFNLAIISEEYKKINNAIFALIFEKISLISKKVITVKNDDQLVITNNNLANLKKYEKDKFITFSLENDINHNLNRYWFLNLAVATHKIGIITSVELAYDPRKNQNINKGFLYFSDQEKMNIVNKIYFTQNNFIGDLTPCFMESEIVLFSNRSISQRIFWEELEFINHESFFKEKKLNSYDKIFLKRKSEINIYSDDFEKHYLPVGIDLEKINKIKKRKIDKDNKFTFLWAEQFSSPLTNLELILNAFKELFENNKNVQIKVIIPNNYRKHYPTEYYNKSLNKMLKNSVAHFRLSHNSYMKKIIKNFNHLENIIFINNNHSDENYSEEVYCCDCFIDIGSTTNIHPLILESIAFGKKIIIINDDKYDDYLPNHSYYKVNYSKKSALFQFGHIENPILDNVDFNRYFLIKHPKIESIKNEMLNSYNDRKNTDINDEYIKDFSDKYNWISIAEKLKEIVYK